MSVCAYSHTHTHTHTHTENEGIGQEGNMRQLDRRREGKPRHRGFVKTNPRTYGLP
jgi:hypothetical protein